MEMSEATLFLDTNSLLHYPPIKNVDWNSACKSSKVRLVLCLQVIHELDEKKDDSRLGDRASRAIKDIKGIRSSGGGVRDGVTLEIFNHEIKASDFPATLSYDSKDDRIVHSVKKFAESNPNARILVYTEDMGMNLRCEAHGLAILEPDPASRLENPQAEHDKRYKMAITELNELKNRVPNLELVISPFDATKPEKQLMRFSLSPTQVNRDLDSEIKQYQDAKNLFPMTKSSISSNGMIPTFEYKHDAVARYNDELANHLNDYRKWLELRDLFQTMLSHQIKMSVWMMNSGVAPGDDLDVTIEVGDPVAILYEASSEEAKEFELPERPIPPERPKQFFIDMVGFEDRLNRMDSVFEAVSRLNCETPIIEKQEDTNSFRIKYSTNRLKHNEFEHIGNMILVLRQNSIHPFEMKYRITAANVIKVIEGTIPIIITQK
jgi:hypothetical protein